LHALRPGDLLVDIGANVGSYTLLGGSAGADVLAFEPIPATFAWLQRNAAVNSFPGQVEVLNMGLGRESGTLSFTAGHDTMNHVLAPGEETANRLDVEVRTLDDVLQGRTPCLIKIDVEGFETEVLAGAETALASPDLLAVIVELNGSGARYGFDDDALHQDLLQRGFETYTYDPLARQLTPRQGARSTKGNTLYVRQADLLAERLRTAPTFALGNGATV